MRKRGQNRNAAGDYNQKTVERVLRMIRLMRGPFRRSRKEYAEMLDVSERSIYRYMNLVESLGFEVLIDDAGHVFMAGGELREAFTDEEAAWVQQAMEAVDAANPLSRSVLRKLDMFGEQEGAIDALVSAGRAQVLAQIAAAIFKRKQLLLIGYYSANSGTRSNRLVEPIELVANHLCLSAFEVESGRNKYYRIDRISEVEVTAEPFAHATEHRALLPDMFGFALPEDEGELVHVRLDLSMKAALFLRSEYPLSIPYLKPAPAPRRFLLEGPVADIRPVKRFVRGFPKGGHVVVLSGLD